jgi:hypothetical protein
MNLSFEKSKHAFLTLGDSLKTIVPVLIALTLMQFAEAQVTVVRAGRLIDPDSGTVLTNQVIMIKDGKIRRWAGNWRFRRTLRGLIFRIRQCCRG